MPVYTLKDIEAMNSKAKSTMRGQRLADMVKKRTKRAPNKRITKKKPAKKAPNSAAAAKDDELDSDGTYRPVKPYEDNDSDDSGVMSVDEHDFEEEVEEVLNEYGGIDRTRCPAKDYKLVEAEVRSSAEFADRGAYRRNQHMALLTELKVNAEAIVNDPDAPTIDCDLQSPDDEAEEGKFALKPDPEMSKKDFHASMTSEYIHQDGRHFYEAAMRDVTSLVPYAKKDGGVVWEKKTVKAVRVFPDGSVALRRRPDLEQPLHGKAKRPNSRKRKEPEIAGKAKEENKKKIKEEIEEEIEEESEEEIKEESDESE